MEKKLFRGLPDGLYPNRETVCVKYDGNNEAEITAFIEAHYDNVVYNRIDCIKHREDYEDETADQYGWYPNEKLWYSLSKDGTYCYQLILKPGDWVAYTPWDRIAYCNCHAGCHLPYSTDWEEVA